MIKEYITAKRKNTYIIRNKNIMCGKVQNKHNFKLNKY